MPKLMRPTGRSPWITLLILIAAMFGLVDHVLAKKAPPVLISDHALTTSSEPDSGGLQIAAPPSNDTCAAPAVLTPEPRHQGRHDRRSGRLSDVGGPLVLFGHRADADDGARARRRLVLHGARRRQLHVLGRSASPGIRHSEPEPRSLRLDRLSAGGSRALHQGREPAVAPDVHLRYRNAATTSPSR